MSVLDRAVVDRLNDELEAARNGERRDWGQIRHYVNEISARMLEAEQQVIWAREREAELEACVSTVADALGKIKELDEDDFKSAYHYQTAVRFHVDGALGASDKVKR